MNIRWISHLKNNDDKERFENRVLECKDVLNHLKKLLEEDLELSVKKQRDVKSYLFSSWSEFQADKIGEQRTLQKIIDLLP